MFDSLGRGLRMIWASIRMGWQDKRLLLPSLITVFTNFLFGTLLLYQGMLVVHNGQEQAQPVVHNLHHQIGHQPFNPANLDPMRMGNMSPMNGLGTFDQGGWADQLSGSSDNIWLGVTIACVWWLTTMFFEGVTIALVYSH